MIDQLLTACVVALAYLASGSLLTAVLSALAYIAFGAILLLALDGSRRWNGLLDAVPPHLDWLAVLVWPLSTLYLVKRHAPRIR